MNFSAYPLIVATPRSLLSLRGSNRGETASRMRERPQRGRQSPGALNAAQALAIAALQFIASDEQRLGHFLATSGIGPESIRDAARETGFLAGVLEYLGSDERLLIEFARDQQLDPPAVMRARDTLAGSRWERDTP